MLVSVITVSRNAATTIGATIRSVRDQDHESIEHIFIDALSTDGTREIIQGYCRDVDYFVSERDDGIYDAMNKGIAASTGEIICILNADDILADSSILSKVVETFETRDVQLVYSDIAYITSECKLTRKWKAGLGSALKTKLGWHPPHPGVFVDAEVYKTFGVFNTMFKIAADYDFLIRVFKDKHLRSYYLKVTTVNMLETGVSSSVQGRLEGLKEIISSLVANRLTIFIPIVLLCRYSQKIVQAIRGKLNS